jgi:O-antigen/teichoic acid export membrane protein
MTRKRLLFRGIGIGYLSMGAGMAYSFLSIPLALAYLGKAEYGLWALIMTISGYLNFTELGISNSIQRHLIEVKEGRPNRAYGGVFLSGALAFTAIGIICALAGCLCIPLLPGLVGVPSEQSATFGLLMAGMVILFALSLMTRILGAPLYVFQRFDLYETGNILLYIVWLGTLYAGLRLGYGVYALLLSQAAGWIFSTIFNLIVCNHLGMYPRRGEWSLPDRKMLREIALFSRDSFLQQSGQQFVASLPVLILTRTIGLDAAATWTVGVRPFFILHQLLRRPFQYAFMMLADTYANRGPEQALHPWIKIARWTTIGAMVAFPTSVFFYGDFMRLWTHGKIAWTLPEASAGGLYFLMLSILNSFYGMVGINKKIGIVRFSSLAEGVLIVLCSIVLCPRFGLMGLIVSLVVSKFLLGAVPTVYYLQDVFGAAMSAVWKDTVFRPLAILPIICVVAWTPFLLLQDDSGWFWLVACGTLSLALAALPGVFLGGAFGEVLSSLSTLRSKLLLRKG